jgi:guanylate kinase
LPVNRLGLLLVISAPSGTGKSTLIRKLCANFPRLVFSVSYTTRAPRPGEVHGKDYHFLSQAEFVELSKQNILAEWAEVHGHFYGTPRPAVLDMLAQGRDVLFDIDIQGARQLRQAFPLGAFVFLLPPSRQALEARLRGRGTEDRETLARRLGNARREIEQADFFEFQIVNDDLEQAYQELQAIYLAEGLRTSYNPTLNKTILDTWSTDG